ncbi:MAG: hypothetical protein GYA17_08830 [Chloroflexi bacterium]|nr:hypothetical protein [Chloroflexota bacterium]
MVERISAADADPIDQLAFVLLMVRLAGCVTCNADAFRAMKGCTQCARQVVRRYRGSDQDLVDQFTESRQEVSEYLAKENA